jgi:SAM-dependent methyltransferase
MWNERYGADEYFYGTEPNGFLRDTASALPRGRTLCLAEGEGRNAVWLAEQGFDVHAVDISTAGVDKTRRLAASRGVNVHAEVGDLNDWVIESDSWDLIVSIFAHTPSALRRRLHRAVVAGLAPGGTFVLEAYTPDQIPLGTGGPKDPDMMPTAALLRDELAGLRFDICRETAREIVEGTGHTGVAAVVQVVATKP